MKKMLCSFFIYCNFLEEFFYLPVKSAVEICRISDADFRNVERFFKVRQSVVTGQEVAAVPYFHGQVQSQSIIVDSNISFQIG